MYYLSPIFSNYITITIAILSYAPYYIEAPPIILDGSFAHSLATLSIAVSLLEVPTLKGPMFLLGAEGSPDL